MKKSIILLGAGIISTLLVSCSNVGNGKGNGNSGENNNPNSMNFNDYSLETVVNTVKSYWARETGLSIDFELTQYHFIIDEDTYDVTEESLKINGEISGKKDSVWFTIDRVLNGETSPKYGFAAKYDSDKSDAICKSYENYKWVDFDAGTYDSIEEKALEVFNYFYMSPEIIQNFASYTPDTYVIKSIAGRECFQFSIDMKNHGKQIVQTVAFDSKILLPMYINIVDNINPSIVSTTALTVSYFGDAKNEPSW
ncbi:MAG: hypothetical protein SOV26_01295 [Candidatus Onthovivens sp.]|nr:hypothetical protein [Candidatus Onthovivens sp.]